MALRSCLVSCRDLAGTEHAVEVTAETLYEAVAQALGILRGDIWVEEIGEGLTELKVRVKQPAVEHRVRMRTSAGGWSRRAGRRQSAPGKGSCGAFSERSSDGVGEGGRAGAVIAPGTVISGCSGAHTVRPA
jgi:hypothetical protein